MRYLKLGNTGLKVSAVTLGCMSWGDTAAGRHPWMQGRGVRPRDDQGGARGRHQLLRHRERLLRRHQRGVHRPRAEGRTPTARTSCSPPRCNGRMRPGPERRRAVPQGDPAGDRRQPAAGSGPTTSTSTRSTGGTRETPIEETMEALHDVVRAGKARYIGASSMYAWQFAKAQHVAERQRLDAVRLDAEPLQPALPRGGAGDAPALRRPGRRRDPVEPAGPRAG